MHYTTDFSEIVCTSKSKGVYVGAGNPNGKILIIGKELAIDEEREKSVFEKTNLLNAADWMFNIQNPQKEILNCENNESLSLFNPLYPYKGMTKNKKSAGHTWRKYQLLYENLFDLNSNIYTFYENIFITELNQNTSKYSSLQNKESRKSSIKLRVNSLFKSKFIQNFPIVIVACGHYPREHDVDICNLFDVDYIPPTQHVADNPRQWYNLHKNKTGEKPKLLIHTRQLSMNISNKLLTEIATEIKNFCELEKITLKETKEKNCL